MSNVALDAPADQRLMEQFIEALKQGDTAAKLDTPAFSQRARMTLGEVLADEIGGDGTGETIAHLLRVLSKAMKCSDVDTRLHAMAAAASLARNYTNTHEKALSLADAEAEDKFRGDYSEVFERAAAFAGACFPNLRRGAL